MEKGGDLVQALQVEAEDLVKKAKTHVCSQHEVPVLELTQELQLIGGGAPEGKNWDEKVTVDMNFDTVLEIAAVGLMMMDAKPLSELLAKMEKAVWIPVGQLQNNMQESVCQMNHSGWCGISGKGH